MMTNVGCFHYIALAFILFIIGILGIILSKTFVKMIFSIELLFNAICISFVSSARYFDNIKLEGYVFVVFIMIVAIFQVVVLSFIVKNIFDYKKSTQVDVMGKMKG